MSKRDGDSQGLEPAPEILRMLIGEQFGGRHQRHLPAGLHGLRRRQGRNQGLAAAHVALHQPQHGFASRRSCSISASARCCAWVKRNGSAASKLALRVPVDGQRPAGIALDALPQQLERQLMREQFLEGQAALRRMPPAQQ